MDAAFSRRVLVIFVLLIAVSWQKTITISNTEPRRDDKGQIMDAHDGNINKWTENGPYYFYGMSYGTCHEEPSGCYNVTVGACGFRLDHNISVWSSNDLSSGSWKFEGYALPVESRPPGIYYRPKIVYNKNTKQYVLWVNFLNGGVFSQSQYLVATSPTPTGPFKVVSSNVQTRYKVGGDFDVYVDDDAHNTAYLIYTSLDNNHQISIEELSSDYLSSLAVSNTSKSSGFFGAQVCEAPALFKHSGHYYALFDHCCCFCGEGSGIGVYLSQKPLGPYTYLDNIGDDASGASITHAQQNYVMQVATTTGIEYIWTGDRWQSAPDKIKAHDFQYWTPLEFEDHGGIKKLHWLNSFTIDEK